MYRTLRYVLDQKKVPMIHKRSVNETLLRSKYGVKLNRVYHNAFFWDCRRRKVIASFQKIFVNMPHNNIRLT
jgi:hypothetical protein